jgi:hypothetical protein
MKKEILMLMLAAMSTGAMAEWVRLWGNDVMDAYVDPDSIRMKGNKVVTQNIFDFKKPIEYLGNEYRSTVNVYEFDCDKERAKALESIWYAENKGEGAIVDSSSLIYQWHRVIPATPISSFMNHACSEVHKK